MQRTNLTIRRNGFVLAGIIVLKFLLQYLAINPVYELQRDEYLHLDQANHLAWGYLSIPPFTSWIAWMIRELGNGVFWVKFFPALFGVLTIVVVWKTIETLGGNLFALVLGSLAVLFSALLRLNSLFQPNSVDVLAWTTFYYIVIKFIQSTDKKWLYLGALVFAAGFLNKYNFVFLLMGLVPAILLTSHRKLFARKSFYFALLLGVVLILPNLWWQYTRSFPVIHHLKKLASTQLVHVSAGEFLQWQLLFFINSLFVIIAALIGLLIYPPLRKYRLFWWSLIFTLSIFMLFHAKGYYAIGIYPVYMAFGSVYLEKLLATSWKRYLRPVALLIPIMLFLPMARFILPVKSPDYIIAHADAYRKLGLLRWEGGKDHSLPQDYADMLGWKELARKVDAAYDKLPDRDATLILCDNYGEAGAINYYSRNKGIQAVTFEANYLNWIQPHEKVRHLIRVKVGSEQSDEMRVTGPLFDTSFVADSIANPFSREYQTTIFVFSGPKIDVSRRLKEEVAKVRRSLEEAR